MAHYIFLRYISSDPPNGVQLLWTAGAAERAVLLTECSLQTWLQKLNSAYKRLTLLQWCHSQKFGLFNTHMKSQNVLHLPEKQNQKHS